MVVVGVIEDGIKVMELNQPLCFCGFRGINKLEGPDNLPLS